MPEIQEGLLKRRPLRLELGCGDDKRDPHSVGVDILPLRGADIVGDAMEFLRTLEDGSVETISSEHFLEHISDVEGLLKEAARVIEPRGRFIATVPHFSNPYFYSDPTHKTFFGLYTFGYYIAESPFRRKVPTYGESLPFHVDGVNLVFQSVRPFYGRHAVKVSLGHLFNANRWTREFWEENLCWIFPCYEIRYVLRRASP
jgi:ubiquinone/menaquinone biosynthesis C-methylase UbiE